MTLYQELASPGLSSVCSEAKLVAFSPRYPKAIQDTLVQNVFLTGGNVMYPGMKARVEKELLEMRPFQSSFQVLSALPTHCW